MSVKVNYTGVFMLCTQISDGKTEKIIKRFRIGDNERFIAYYDETMFISGKKGLIGTDKRIIKFNDKAVNEYPVESIETISVVEVNKQQYLYKLILTTKDKKEVDLTPKGIANDELFLLGKLIGAVLK